MEDFARRYLQYLRISLADGARLAPKPEEGIEVDASSVSGGKIGPTATAALFNRAKADKPRGLQDEQLWPLKVLVCPYVYALRPEHARSPTQLPSQVVPLVLSAKLHKDGSLEADESCPVPLIPREYLEPSSCDVNLATIEEADATYATLDTAARGWNALFSRAQELISKVTGQDPETLILENYEKHAYSLCLLQKVGGNVIQIERLLDVMLKDRARAYPLLEALLTSAPDLPVKSPFECLCASALHVGEMECGYPLSPSQREALVHHLARPIEAPDILAIDGPPGTGKTTLLLSVIATMWVQRAMEEAEAPLIVATSTNNQAVDNILVAYRKVEEPDHPLSGRWLPGIRDYGQLLPSRTRAEAGTTKDFHIVIDSPGGFQHSAQEFENPEGLRRARTQFLERFQRAFPQQQTPELQHAKQILHEQLKKNVDSILTTVDALSMMVRFIPLTSISITNCQMRASQFEAQIQDFSTRLQLAQDRLRKGKLLHRDWKAHLSAEPLWRAVLAVVGFQLPRQRRDELFCAGAAIEYEALVAGTLRQAKGRPQIDRLIEDLIDTLEAGMRSAAEALRNLELEAQSFSRTHSELQKWHSEKSDGSIESIQAALDLGPRYQAFKLATHYWEARYLLEVEQQLRDKGAMDDTRNPIKLERFYRRLAKLFPYCVTTTYTLPGRFRGWVGEDQPLFEAIDLLIIDEAGQIAPEVGVLPFALAKRALVVGDVDQLRPIWAIPAPLDAVNALRFGLVGSREEQTSFPEQALAVSGGSLMRIAQRATPFSPYSQRGRGMLLREHRRCWPEIIQICNTLVYRDLLIPKRDDTKKERKISPSVGYVHIPGTDQFRSKSRFNPTEASAIAKWLSQCHSQIEKAFRDEHKPLSQLVAVVTPFVAQAKAIRSALRSELGSDLDITVGTVDALQGAEYRVVIFSPTYGVGTRPGNTRFDRNTSFLNVAISRAQDAFLIFGNMHLFKPQGSHPSAVVGRFLFTGGENELKDVPVELLVPGQDLPPGHLIRDLDAHRNVLTEALRTARFRLVIVSPFLTSSAIEADDIPAKIRRATDRGVSVKIVSDAMFNSNRIQFEHCTRALVQAGAEVRAADGPSVHSKLILVDSSWLVVGSFNWLSSPRDARNSYVRYETSLRYDGNEAFEMIRESLKDLAAIVPKHRTPK